MAIIHEAKTSSISWKLYHNNSRLNIYFFGVLFKGCSAIGAIKFKISLIFNFFFIFNLIQTLKVVSATLLVCFLSSKREQLWNFEKDFLFQFKSSFYSWENQILDIQISWRHKCLSVKQEIHFTE